MKAAVRFALELLLFGVFAGLLLLGVLLATLHLFTDEKTQYFVIGYYAAVHAAVARWIWKRLGIDKEPSS